MDPTSQDNSFGSFGPGGNNPGASIGVSGNNAMNVGSVPVASGPVPASGAPVSGSMASNGLGQMGQVGQTDQAQAYQASRMDMMNQMGINPMTTSPDSGDIVIGGSGKDKKKWIIGIVVLIVLVLLGVGGYFLVGNLIKNSGFLATSGFNELAELLVNGDGAVDIESSDYIYAVAISDQSDEVISTYYAKLNDRATSFFEKAEGHIALDVFTEYQEIINILKYVINNEDIKEALVDKYNESGKSVAEDYLRNSLSCASNGILNSVCLNVFEYYKGILEEHEYYEKAGCYSDGFYSTSCAKEYYSESDFAEMLVASDLNQVRFVDFSSSAVLKSLSDAVIEIQDEIREMKNYE